MGAELLAGGRAPVPGWMPVSLLGDVQPVCLCGSTLNALGILAVLLFLYAVPLYNSASFNVLSSFRCVAELWGLCAVTRHSALMQVLIVYNALFFSRGTFA